MELNGSQSAPDPPRHEAIHRAVVQRGCSHIPGVSRDPPTPTAGPRVCPREAGSRWTAPVVRSVGSSSTNQRQLISDCIF
ncbi:unnamed protein product [Gadus morhua 'NCC']